MNDPGNNNNTQDSRGSDLCLSCGICCEGIIHTHAIVYENEVKEIEKFGLSYIKDSSGKDGFLLPCKLFIDRKCSIYTDRLSPCVGYRCKLLKRFLTNEISLNESKWIAEEAKKLITLTKRNILIGKTSGNFWSEINKSLRLSQETFPSLEEKDIPFILPLIKLDILIKKYFVDE